MDQNGVAYNVEQAGRAGSMTATINTRLAHLGVPAAFHSEIVERQAPRFHILLHLTIILASVAAAVTAIVIWSRYVAAAALEAARSAHAILYDSDIGAESLGLILTVLFAAGWLCGAITWRRGSEPARNGWAGDLLHEPAKNKAITDWLWRQSVRRYTRAAISADDFLDRLGKGIVRDLRYAALAMFVLTIALGAALPARLSCATANEIADLPVLPLTQRVVRPLATATSIISGCPKLPKDGSTIVFRVQFADGAEANLGSWNSIMGSRLAALEAIANKLPVSATRIRFSNAIGSDPLSAECLKEFASNEGPDGLMRLLRLLSVTDVERKVLTGSF